MDDVTERKPATLLRRFRPRLSLLTALLLMTIVGIVIVTVRLWREVEPLRQDLFRLRQELGYLSIKDENKIYAIQVPGGMPGVSRFRVYLPKNHNLRINSRIQTVPGKALKQSRQDWLETLPGSGSSSDIESGEYTIDVSMQSAPNVKDQWVLVYQIAGKGGGSTGTVMPWLNDRRVWSFSSEASIGKQKEFNPEDGIVLLTLRQANIKVIKGGYSTTGPDESKETPGVMLWIAPEVKGQ